MMQYVPQSTTPPVKLCGHNIKTLPVVACMLWLLLAAPLFAQTGYNAYLPAPPALPSQSGGKAKGDTGDSLRHAAPAAGTRLPASLGRQQHHNPRKALLLSAVVPGAGQIYNGQAWKVPIVYAALGAGSYMIYSFYGKMNDCKTEYLYRINHDDAVQNASFAEDPTANVYNLYETYNQRFQLSVIVTAALYGLNLLDAFVFGHLYEFEIDDNLSLSCKPFLDYVPSVGMVTSASLTLRF